MYFSQLIIRPDPTDKMDVLRQSIARSYFVAFLVGLAFGARIHAARAESCIEQRLNELILDYHGRPVRVLTPPRGEALDVSAAFGGNDQVLLGITGHHYYLQVGDVRIEGGPVPVPIKKLDGTRISNGYVIRFPDVPAEKISAWQERMSQGSPFRGFAMSCTQAACSALDRDFEIRVAGSHGPNILSSTTFDKIIKNGFVDEDGKPVEFEISRVSSHTQDLNTLSSHLTATDAIAGAGTVLVFAASGSVVTMVVIFAEVKIRALR